MRYTNLSAFQKHLASSSPHHLCRLYLIAGSDDFERKKALDLILSYAALPDSLVVRLSGIESTSFHVLDALNSPSLFGQEPIVLVDEADKKLLDALAAWFKKEPLSFGYLFLGTKSKAGASFVETQGVVCDLLEEKPWEKEKRWMDLLSEMAKSAGKRLAPEAAVLLLKRLDSDAALLSMEMEKLLCYSSDQSVIGCADVEKVSAASRSHTLWQIAESVVWDKGFPVAQADLQEASFFHGLLGGLRQQLSIGMKMHQLMASHTPLSEWGPYFPKMWGKAIEKKADRARELGAAHFRKGLDNLFEIELLAKSSSVPTEALLDSFRLKLSYVR